MRTRRVLIRLIAIAVIAFAVAVLFVVGNSIRSGPEPVNTTVEARVVRLTADPHLLMVGVPWTKDGWCVGELMSYAKETADAIFIGPVTDLSVGSGICAGVGALFDTAYAELTLSAPVGSRAIVRARDGLRLPVLTDQDHFVPKHPTAADIGQYASLNDFPPVHLKKQVHDTNAVALESVAEELDSLERFPSGTIFCPNDDGSYYLVDYSYGDSVDFPIKIDATGCGGVFIFGLDKPAASTLGTSTSIAATLAALVNSQP